MTKEELHRAIDALDDEQVAKVGAVLEALSAEDPLERWRRIPGLRAPVQWPPDYGDFEPVNVEGEPVSEQIIRERR